MSISARMVKRAGTRRNGATVVSHCGGSVDGRFATGKRDISCRTEGVPGSFLLENLGYTFGFIIVIMARQQLFTENTVTAVLPVMQKPTMSNVGLLMRLWGVVLLGNILGTGIAAWAFEYMPIFNEETRDAFVKIGMDVMKNTPSEMFANAIISGWLIATMVWMFPAAGAAKIVVIILMTWLIALGDTTHIVVGSVEILYLVFNGTLHWSDFIWPFALPTLAGNICGGTFIFALMSHAQIRNDMSNKRKAEARQKAERAENIKKMIKPSINGEGLSNRAAAYLPRSPLAGILMPHCPLS